MTAAQGLFAQSGCETVTIADILDASGLSKGGFYHHFKSKEDVLEELVNRITQSALKAGIHAERATSGTALDRLNAFGMGASSWKMHNRAELSVAAQIMALPGNDSLHMRLRQAIRAAVEPLLRGLIRDGVQEGVFSVADESLAAEVLIALSEGRRESMIRAIAKAQAGHPNEGAAELVQRLQAEGHTVDRLLGLPEGSVKLACPNDISDVVGALALTLPPQK